jgi:hypothetical protein
MNGHSLSRTRFQQIVVARASMDRTFFHRRGSAAGELDARHDAGAVLSEGGNSNDQDENRYDCGSGEKSVPGFHGFDSGLPGKEAGGEPASFL